MFYFVTGYPSCYPVKPCNPVHTYINNRWVANLKIPAFITLIKQASLRVQTNGKQKAATTYYSRSTTNTFEHENHKNKDITFLMLNKS